MSDSGAKTPGFRGETVILKFLSNFKAFLQNHPVVVVLVGGCLAHDEESVLFEGFVHVFEGIVIDNGGVHGV